MKSLKLVLVFLSFYFLSFSQENGCDDHRKNVRGLLIEEKIELNQLILDYLVSVPNSNYDPNSPNPLESFIEYKYDIIAQHTVYGDNAATAANHQNEQFLSWHREYITGLEQYLLDEGKTQYVPLPYWDPTQAIPGEFYDQFIPEFYDGIDTPVNPAGSQNVANYISDPEETWPSSILITDDLCADYETADDLGNALVSDIMHASVHFEMGGAMSSQAATSGASAFWILHANIDRFYRCYQVNCQCPEIDVSLFNDGCDVCLDLSSTIRADEYEFVLVDASGNESIVELNEAGCISYNNFNQGDQYTLKVKGINNGMMDNLDCPLDEVEISFTAPDPPSNKYNPSPCIQVEQYPQFPSPATMEGMKSVKIVNNGISRSMNFYNMHTLSGTVHTLETNVWLETNEEVIIEIPNSMLTVGSNFFVAEVEGETIEYQFIIE